MSRLLSRMPRETKVAAVVLGAALLQVGLLAFFGLRSTDERRDELETALRDRAERVVTRSVVSAGQSRIAALRRNAEHELARQDRPLEDRVRAALAAAPAFTHAFVVTTGGPLGPRLHEFRRPPLPVAKRTAIDSDARATLRELETQWVTDPEIALATAISLADRTDDAVARALALRVGWRAARRSNEEPTALALAERVLRDMPTVLDDRGERADHAPFGASAAAVVTDIWVRALLSKAGIDTTAFVDVVIDRRIRAQQMRHLMDDAAYAVERDACRDLRDRAQVHLPVERLRQLDATLAACDELDDARDRIHAIPDYDIRGALERGGGWLASGAGDAAVSATLITLGEGEAGVARAVLLMAPRSAVLDSFLAPLRDGVDAPHGVAISVRDAAGTPVVGPGAGDELVPLRPLGPALPGVTAGALLADPSVLARETERERRLWLWVLVAAALAVMAASLLAVRAVLREVRLARMKGDFVSSLSHELRTPLTSLRMFVETLQEGRVRDAAEAQEYLDVIGRETNRLSTLVDRILHFAAFSRGRAPIELRSVDPHEVVERAVELFRQRAKTAGATVEVVSSKELPEVLLDRDALIQVLLNLLDNAVKYGGDNGARIRVAVRAAGSRVRFEVEDDGPGVPERERELVFEEFYRGDESLSSRKQGAGIGLALCRRIVLAHGGKIAVTDGPILGGALVAVTLPDAAVGRRLALAARAGGAG